MATDFERALLGEDTPVTSRYRHGPPPGQKREKQRKSRVTAETTVAKVKGAASAPEKPREPAGDVFGRLADLFLSQPWIAAHRGNDALLKPVPVDTGLGLTAKILRERIEKEPRFEGRSEEKIEEVVEYAMKHFFDRLDNSQRSGRHVNQFVSSDWWDTLIPEAIDHWQTIRIGPEAFERGRQEAEAFYAAWPKRDARTPRLLIRTDHPNYDDCEELI